MRTLLELIVTCIGFVVDSARFVGVVGGYFVATSLLHGHCLFVFFARLGLVVFMMIPMLPDNVIIYCGWHCA